MWKQVKSKFLLNTRKSMIKYVKDKTEKDNKQKLKHTFKINGSFKLNP